MNKRLAGIDGLRGIAALAVVAYHYAEYSAYYGMLGVELFFVISGFVILMSLERIESLGEFAIHRFARLYPAYWLSIPVAVVAFWPSLPSTLVNMTMLQAFLRQPNISDPYWTLGFELWFYVALAGLYAFGLLKHVERLALAWLAVMFGFRLALYFDHLHWLFANQTFRLLAMPLFGHFFIAGMMIYRLATGRRSPRTLLCLAFACLYSGFGRPDWTAIPAFIYLPATIAFVAAVVWCSTERNAFEWRPLVWLGQRSYSIYLLNWPLHAIAVGAFGETAGIFAGLAATLALSSLSWGWIERPAQRLARRFSP